MKLLKVIFLATAFVLAADYALAQGTISGVVVDDTNEDGVADSGEQTQEGVTVTLVDADGTVIATVVTDASGAYTFSGVNAGNYRIQFTYPTTPPLTVQSPSFSFDGTNYAFNAPVVNQANAFSASMSPNLSVVNPAGTRGRDVSPFKP